MSVATQRVQIDFDKTNSNIENKSADIVNLFKLPKEGKLKKAVVNKLMLNKPTWLPILRPENLELEEFLDNGVVKLKYKDKEEFEMFFNPVFGSPGKFEEKLFYVLLSACQVQRQLGVENFRELRFSSLYGILGLMGYDRDSARRSELLDKVDEALKKLATTGVHHKKFYLGKDRKGNNMYGKVFVSSMIDAIWVNNVFSGRAHTLKITINENYYVTTLAHQFQITDLDIPALADISSAPALRMYEVLNSKDYTFERRGWWCVYLDNFLESFGVKGKFQYQSEKLRFLEDAFQKCKPALRYPLEEEIKDSILFTYWQNKSKRFRKDQDLTLCFYTSRWEPVVVRDKKELEEGIISDINLPEELFIGLG